MLLETCVLGLDVIVGTHVVVVVIILYGSSYVRTRHGGLIMWRSLSGVDYVILSRDDGGIFIRANLEPRNYYVVMCECILPQVVSSRTLVIWVGARQLDIRAYVVDPWEG